MSATPVSAFLLLASTLIGTSSPTMADTFRFDYGNTSTTDQLITITRVPVTDSDGNVHYKDVQIKLKLLPNGRFATAPGFPKTSASPTLFSAKITAGRYKVNGLQSSTGKPYFVQIIGPSVGPNNREQWVLAGIGTPANMTFYSGPVKGHPLQKRLNAAGITSAPDYFGTSSDNGTEGMFVGAYFGIGALVSLAPSGNNIQINSYSFNLKDKSLPLKSELLVKCTTFACKD